MKTAELMLAQDYLRYQKMIQAMEAEFMQLPKGALAFRNIKGHDYCHLQFRDSEGKIHNDRILPADIQQMRRLINRRKELKTEIQSYQQMIQKLEKTFPQLPAIAATLLSTTLTPSAKNPDKPYSTAKGDYVRSKSEVIIADELYTNQISYEYEKPLQLEGARHPLYPDFTIYTPHQKQVVLWEHCGLMNDPSYRDKWEWKKKIYEHAGFCEWNKNLIITYEAAGGDLNIDEIRQFVANLLHR